MVSGTFSLNVPVYGFAGYFVSGNHRAGRSKYAQSLPIDATLTFGTGLFSTFANSPPYANVSETVFPVATGVGRVTDRNIGDRKSTRLNSSHANISYAVFCLKKKKKK